MSRKNIALFGMLALLIPLGASSGAFANHQTQTAKAKAWPDLLAAFNPTMQSVAGEPRIVRFNVGFQPLPGLGCR
jgi:hypothetical protein